MLVLKSRAEMLERGEGALHSERLELDRPCVIRLVRYVRIPRDVHRRKITRKAVLARDAYTCQYCGHEATGLTVDHVIPRSRGGQSVWENIVASCAPCNRKKGNRMPREARDAPDQPAAAAGRRPCSSGSPRPGSRSPGSRTWRRVVRAAAAEKRRAAPTLRAALPRCDFRRVSDSRPGGTVPASGARRCLGLDSARRLARCPPASTVTRRPDGAAD